MAIQQPHTPPAFLGGNSHLAGNNLSAASPTSPLQALILRLLIRKGMRAIGTPGAAPPSAIHPVSGIRMFKP